MNRAEFIRKALSLHKIDQDSPAMMAKCKACNWIGWHFDVHIAEMIDLALDLRDDIVTTERLAEFRDGTIIRAELIDTVYEKAGERWHMLSVDGNSPVDPYDELLPAVLLWEPLASD